MHCTNVYAHAERASRRYVSPAEFLQWAIADIGPGGRRGIASAVTNAKRAIHCRINEIIFPFRVSFANNWPLRPDTDLLLKVLRRAQVPSQSVVRLLTDQRNAFEHQYRLPTQQDARAAVEIADLWVNRCQDHVRPRITIAGLPILSFRVTYDSKRHRETVQIQLNERGPVMFFSDRRRCIVKLGVNGSLAEIPYASLSWKEMIDLQRPYVRGRASGFLVSARLALPIFRAYHRWILKGRPSSFQATCPYP